MSKVLADVRGLRGGVSQDERHRAIAEADAQVLPEHGPDWARFDGPAEPSWLGRDDIYPITKPRELREIIARL